MSWKNQVRFKKPPRPKRTYNPGYGRCLGGNKKKRRRGGSSELSKFAAMQERFRAEDRELDRKLMKAAGLIPLDAI